MGVLGRDPETKQFPNGGSVTHSALLSSLEKYKTTGGVKRPVGGIGITINGRLADVASKITSKRKAGHIGVHCVLGSGKTKTE